MKQKIKWKLIIYDTLIYLFCCFLIFVLYPNNIENLNTMQLAIHVLIGIMCIMFSRIHFRIYGQIWRYANAKEYIAFIVSDAVACALFVAARFLLANRISFVKAIALIMLNLLVCISVRLLYQLVYQKRTNRSWYEKTALLLLRTFTGSSFADQMTESKKIKVAIIGAGSVGVMLAEELHHNPKATYEPVCFVDIDKEKTGRKISDIPVLSGDDNLGANLEAYGVQEVVFALPNITTERRQELYELYKGFGYKIKAYDYPVLESDDGKRRIHDFTIEDLLFRSAIQFLNTKTMEWYKGKNVLITGGGGSIGSELARQIAKCKPARLVILDVYEHGAYDIEQELKTKYKGDLNLRIEIANVCDADQIDKIFREHTPDIVLHAAAHKHVPLMERNIIEAVKNNVFGTLNVVEACERHHVKRFIMVSTDKAVNPTNVMGATKRMCEMIVLSRRGKITNFSATRFGNVLGSNGSVIPLFKRQIANGGPVTITDKRIIRYFMTIPEATQLVMTSGAMASNGELYVLDMGKPVKILDLAENMIRLSGFEPYKDIDIIEIGLRPGEKLYEELLIKTEKLEKTENHMIFVERDKPISSEEIAWKLDVLRTAIESQSNRVVKTALMEVVPTYQSPEEVNEKANESEEMKFTVSV